MSSREKHTVSERRVKPVMVVVSASFVAFGLLLVGLVITGRTWRAIAYATVALFAFLFLEAIYFWGTMVLGGVVSLVQRRRTPVPWALEANGLSETPAYALDPGLEVLAAGMLVYRWDVARPQAYFREISLASARALRPFIVARTGLPRSIPFAFSLAGETAQARFREEFMFDVGHAARLIMPPYRLQLEMPQRLVGRRWQLQVRSGVTVVTALRFVFINGQESQPERTLPDDVMPGEWTNWPDGDDRAAFAQWLNEALNDGELQSTRDVVLEDG